VPVLVPEHARKVTCQTDGKWSSPTPKCIPRVCDILVPPEHSALNCSGLSIGSLCFVECVDQYYLSPTAAVARCTDSGVWVWENPAAIADTSSFAPVCVQTACSDMPNRGNGNIVCVAERADETPDDSRFAIVVSSEQAGGSDAVQVIGRWEKSFDNSLQRFGSSYLHDGGNKEALKSVAFQARALSLGVYPVFVRFVSDSECTKAAVVKIDHFDGSSIATVDLSVRGGEWIHLGTFRFDSNHARVTVFSGKGEEGKVTVNAVMWLLDVELAPGVLLKASRENSFRKWRAKVSGSNQPMVPAFSFTTLTNSRTRTSFDSRHTLLRTPRIGSCSSGLAFLLDSLLTFQLLFATSWAPRNCCLI